jgi:hypothetical protein
VRYPFDYYILRVANEEVTTVNGGKYNDVGAKAFFALAQNYAWLRKTNASGRSYDVVNSTNDQCFRESRSVSNSRWHLWLQTVLKDRIATGSNTLGLTSYASGTAPGAVAGACALLLSDELEGEVRSPTSKALGRHRHGEHCQRAKADHVQLPVARPHGFRELQCRLAILG